MHRTILGSITVMGALALAGMLHAHEGAKGKVPTVTVTGEVLDPICYLGHGAKGPGHAKCAQACLKNGAPPILLGKDGKLYLLLPTHQSNKAYDETRTLGAHRVEVKGLLLSKGGMQAIALKAVADKGLAVGASSTAHPAKGVDEHPAGSGAGGGHGEHPR